MAEKLRRSGHPDVMSYTPRRVSALSNVGARIDAQDKADAIEAVAIGSHGGKRTAAIVKKLREVL